MYENNLKEAVASAKSICVTAHINPDGDAVGSALGMALVLRKLGKEPVVVLNGYGEEMQIISGMDMIYNGDKDLLEPELLIAVDCSTKDRLCCGEELFDIAKITYSFDHHISNENFADYNIVNPKASSACEVVYECINGLVELDKDIATALYAGILTDTGCFRHNCTSRRTHEIAGALIEYGVDTPYLHFKLLMEHSLVNARVLARAIENIKSENGFTYTSISAEELAECGASSNDLGGVIDYLLNIKNTRTAMLASERDGGIVKLSFRSRDMDVNAIAAEFGGGGHILAAGAAVNGELNEVVSKAAEAVKAKL